MRKLSISKIFFFGVVLIILVVGANSTAYTQRLDSVKINLESAFTISNQNYLPQWIVANRFGKFEDQSSNGYLMAGIHSPYLNKRNWDFAWGLDLLGNSELSESRIHQGYAKIKYKFIELSAGWMERTVGVHRPDLSTGSWGISRNARPLPSIILAVPEYTPVPLTKGYLEFKGHIGHSWLEEDRYIANPLLHEKSFYLQGKGKSYPIKVYLGLVHFAKWGGTRPNGRELDSELVDYWRVITGQNSRTAAGGGDFVNALGSHIGTIDFGFELPLATGTLSFYHQDPFEDRLGITRYYFYDQISGLSWQREKGKLIQEILYEFTYSEHQGGPGIPDPPPGTDPLDLEPNFGYRYGGRDDYYNNFLYQSGWTFHQRSIGTPLFLTDQRSRQIGVNVTNYGEAFISNRILAHHIALAGNYQRVNYRLLTTYTRHSGTYAGLNDGRFNWGSREPNFDHENYFFFEPRHQASLLLELERSFLPNRQLQSTTAIAFDFGNLYQTFGLMLKLRWNLHPFDNSTSRKQ
ncbi:capsule assembly Wzi family protein [Tunicatimonas pelagia]|uniref:capsule assembly Wzi family protein n=1 Tax=Tunicatimonas pelagia TaxID=931531 RepID=UPI002666E435|nr:capsule assembly Wzi family protein [Tunicatimonas pelagia]WKN40693.1 capsule assembly Wzi family protein [Tunicatimonas pelagia]